MLYPFGIQSFKEIRQDGYVYVDKTADIYKLVTTGKFYFLGRPRRFGKSLLISTLEAYFKGKKELFQGLAIESLEKDWIEYPVLKLDLSTYHYTLESLMKGLDYTLSKWEREYGVTKCPYGPEYRFEKIIQAAHKQTGRNVVILVDECYKPVMDTIKEPEIRASIHRTLDSFYSVLKTANEHIEFAFFTSVTRIVASSQRSGFDNFADISWDFKYANICGFSSEELRTVFKEDVRELAESSGIPEEDCYERLSREYGGYHFCHRGMETYNPSSILTAFSERRIGHFWAPVSITPFIAKEMRRKSYYLERLSDMTLSCGAIGVLEPEYINLTTLMVHNGYLTISGYDEKMRYYSLTFPNREVKDGFLRYLLSYFLSRIGRPINADGVLWAQDFRRGDTWSLRERLKNLFGKEYSVDEKDFRNILYLISEQVKDFAEVERDSSKDGISFLVRTPDYVYDISVVIGSNTGPAQTAMLYSHRRIEKDSCTVFIIDIHFSTDAHCVDSIKLAE